MSDESQSRSRVARTLLIELAVILVLLAAAGATIYLVTRPKAVHTERRLAGRELDVSENGRTQSGPALALDPANPHVLLAGSTDDLDDTRVYQSTDSGETWSSVPGPPLLRGACDTDRPAVAIGGRGRQLFAFTATTYCDFQTPKLHIASRRDPGASWRVTAVAPVRGYAADRHLSLAATGERAYVAWVRRPQRYSDRVLALYARSADGGRTWSAASRLPVGVPIALALAARGNDVYLAAVDGATGTLELMHSADAGRSFGRPLVVAKLHAGSDPTCEGVPLPPQPRTCLSPAPSLALTRAGDVDVAWTDLDPNATGGIRFARFSGSLHRRLGPRQIVPRDRKPSDQFDVAVAVDASSGDLWACFEDTFGDPYRRQAWPTCTLSHDGGRHWRPPVRVAGKASDETQTEADIYGYGSLAVVAAEGDAHPMWTDTRKIASKNEEIYASRVPARALR